MDLVERIEAHLKQFASAPYLFVGSGIARRYLGLEDWKGLLEKQCEQHQLDFGYLNASAQGDLPKLASAMAQELHPKWWKDRKYKKSREQFGQLAVGEESALKFEIAKYISTEGTLTTDKALLEELEIFKKVVVDGIITTNWDGLLEALFSDYAVYVGQEALLFAQIQGIGEIYKIHGSFSDPNSLVLTSSDYDEFHRKNPYLASKLLTFFVENPVVFLGYSLTDRNVLDIVHSILSCLSSPNIEKLADRLVFVQWDPQSKEDRFERTILTNEGRTLPVFQVTTSSMSSVLLALTRIQRKIPAKVLRMLKRQVFELVHGTQPSQKVFVQDINDSTDLNNIEFAIGVGIQERFRDKGYTALTRQDLVRDVLLNNGAYAADLIVRDTLPELLKGTKYVPVFKYLSLIKQSAEGKDGNLAARVARAAGATVESFRPGGIGKALKVELEAYPKDFDAFVEQNDLEVVVNHAGMLPIKSLKITQLKRFLTQHIDLMDHPKANVKVNFFKLICIFDLLRYKEEAAIRK